MLSYFAEFPLKTSDVNEVLDCVIIWLKGSPYRVFDDENLSNVRNGGIESISCKGQSLQFLQIDDKTGISAGVKHVSVDKDISYYTTIVSKNIDEITWVSVATGRAALSPQISLKEAKKPQIVKGLLAAIGGGLDGELWVSDLPRLLSPSDIAMAARLINGDSGSHLPVVYVSRDFKNNILVDVMSLAAHLGGLAHVVVEPSRIFSREIQFLTGSNNAYGGAVGIHLPTGRRSLVLPEYGSDWEFRLKITEIVRDSLLTRLPISGFSWADMEAENSRKVVQKLRDAGSTDLDAFISAFDAENKALIVKNKAQQDEINYLKNEIQSITSLSARKKSVNKATESVQSFFPGEAEHILKDALNYSLSALDGVNRRKFVLQEIFDTLSFSDELQKRRAKLKSILSKYEKLDSKTAKALEDLGFSISSDGKHHKLLYFGDERLTFTMAKTPSDWRAGKNFASDVIRKIY